MAYLNALLVTAVTGTLLLAVVVGVLRLGHWRRYTPSPAGGQPVLGSTEGGATATESDAESRVVWAIIGLSLLTVVGLAAVVVLPALVPFDGLGVAIVLIPGLLVVPYLGWGVYHLSRSRGLRNAQAVGMSLWVLGVGFVGVVAASLLLA